MSLVLKPHYGCSNRYTTLFLDLHPVTCGSLFNLITLDCTSYVNGSPKEEEFLCECCLPCVWVANNSERSSLVYLVFIFVHCALLVGLQLLLML